MSSNLWHAINFKIWMCVLESIRERKCHIISKCIYSDGIRAGMRMAKEQSQKNLSKPSDHWIEFVKVSRWRCEATMWRIVHERNRMHEKVCLVAGTQPGVPRDDKGVGRLKHCWRTGKGAAEAVSWLVTWFPRYRPDSLLRSLRQHIVGDRKPLKKFKQEVKSIFTFFPSFQELPMRGFTDNCFCIKLLPPQALYNLFSLLHFYSHENMIIWISDSNLHRKIIVGYMLSLLGVLHDLLSLISFCPDLYCLKSFSLQRPISMTTSPSSIQQLTIVIWTPFDIFELSFIELLLIYVTLCGLFSLLDWALWVWGWGLNIILILC